MTTLQIEYPTDLMIAQGRYISASLRAQVLRAAGEITPEHGDEL